MKIESKSKILIYLALIFIFFSNTLLAQKNANTSLEKTPIQTLENNGPKLCELYALDFIVPKSRIHKLNRITGEILATWELPGDNFFYPNGIAANVDDFRVIYSNGNVSKYQFDTGTYSSTFSSLFENHLVNDSGVFTNATTILASNQNLGQLYYVNLTNPALTILGPTAPGHILDTAILNNTIYHVAIPSTDPGTTSVLYSFNPATNQHTAIGNTNFRITGIASVNSELWGLSQDGNIYKLNVNNGQATFHYDLPLTGKGFDLASTPCKEIVNPPRPSCKASLNLATNIVTVTWVNIVGGGTILVNQVPTISFLPAQGNLQFGPYTEFSSKNYQITFGHSTINCGMVAWP